MSSIRIIHIIHNFESTETHCLSVFASFFLCVIIGYRLEIQSSFLIKRSCSERRIFMDNILLCSNHIPLVTSIHNTFIEKYMLRANGSYVKVYLYLSKCIQAGEEDLSISSLADQMENTEKDVIRALNYWEKQGLMRITRSEDGADILGIDVLNPDETAAAGTTTVPVTTGAKRSSVSAGAAAAPSETRTAPSAEHVQKSAESPAAASATETRASKISAVKTGGATDKVPSTGHIAGNAAAGNTSAGGPVTGNTTVRNTTAESTPKVIKVTTEQMNRLADNDDFCWTCNVVESYLGRPIKPKEMQLITYLYDTLHFSSELILHLYEYCISLGKTSSNYIQAVALSWDEKQVRTPEDAQNATTEYNAAYTAVSKSLALGRSLAAVEKEFVDRWQNKWSMDLSVILEACNRTMLKLQHGDFKYTEGILDRWHKSGVHTLTDIQKADEAFAMEKAAKKAAEQAGNGSGMVQHGLSKTQAAALEKRLLNA